MESVEQPQQYPCDIDLDLDISLSTYDGPLYNLHKLAIQYTYDGDQIYTVSQQAITPVIHRMTEYSLVELSIWADVLRYTVQQELGRRSLGEAADQAASHFFKVGKPLGTYDREHGGRSTRVPTPVDPELFADLDDLEL